MTTYETANTYGTAGYATTATVGAPTYSNTYGNTGYGATATGAGGYTTYGSPVVAEGQYRVSNVQPYTTTTTTNPVTFGYANTGAGYQTANAAYTTTYQPPVIGTSQVHNYATATTPTYVTETRVVEPVRQQVVTTTTTQQEQVAQAAQRVTQVAQVAPVAAVAATTTVAKQTDVI